MTTRNYNPKLTQDFLSLAGQKATATFSPQEFDALLSGIRKAKNGQ
jgi:hypothetical protein